MPERAIRIDLTAPLTLASLATKVKPKWKVPLQSLIARARDLEIVTDRQYRYLFEQLRDRGWDSEEPNGGLQEERPRLLRQMVEMVYGSPIDYKSLSKDVAVPSEYLRNLMDRFQPQMDKAVAKRMQKVVPLRPKQTK